MMKFKRYGGRKLILGWAGQILLQWTRIEGEKIQSLHPKSTFATELCCMSTSQNHFYSVIDFQY